MNFFFLIVFTLTTTTLASSLPPLQHAKTYKDQNISGWVMSEKLDGIRGYWDGEAMYTKQGKKLNPPKTFIEHFPPFALDGELWSERQDFEAIQSAVLKHRGNWESISYNIFEVPRANGDFLIRLKKAQDWFHKHPSNHVRVIKQYPCRDQETLLKYLAFVTSKGGEGVMVKDPTHFYFQGRSPHILKVKQAHDMEGKIITINYRSNTHILKSLTLQLKSGITFNLGNGFTKKQRLEPPNIGNVVTFKYYGFTKNAKPKFASYLRTRVILQHKTHLHHLDDSK